MPDFEKLLRQKLGSWNCPRHDDVVRELAAHLEDRFQELVCEGMPPDKAVLAAFEIVGDWRELRTEIAAARRGAMTERARCILIPGAVALLIAVLAERLLWPMAGAARSFLGLLWITLVAPNLFAGAVGATASLYAGGSRSQRIWAAEIPALSALSLFLVMSTWDISKYGFAWQTLSASALRNLLFAVLIPAGALFGGALPLLASGSKSHGEKTVEA